MTKEIEKLELAILIDVFRYRRVVDLKLPIIHYDSTHSCNHLVLNGFRNILCRISGCSFQVMLQCLVAAVNSKF